ncbi:hypothetical protein ABZ671_00180 [Micromonospora sp. NPDC006766]|uniref:hypothetical protein n=1 Tax=Micromonospora sp. NPDC006766 TaxID=3154778 RepID=UPI0033C548D9
MSAPCDNQAGGLERPSFVTDDELERALRDTFARRVATPRPLVADPAGLAVRRARRVGRRRALTGFALAGVATVLVTTGMAQLGASTGPDGPPIVVLGDPRGPSPLPTVAAPTAGPVRPELDLIVGAWLYTNGGERWELTGVSPVERAQRVPDHGGWLLTSAVTAAGRTLWWMPPNGRPPQVLLAGADAIAVGADGRRVAWRDGTEVFAAGAVAGQLLATTRTAAPAGGVPVGFAGDTVLIRQPDPSGFRVWHSRVEDRLGTVNRDVLNVYGVRPDGLVVGQVSAGTPRRPCLALLDPARDLAPVRTGCGPELATDGHGDVSLDGRWLLVNGARNAALLVDLDALGAGGSARAAGPALTGVVTWTRSGAALHVDATGALVRVRPDEVTAGEQPFSAPVDGVAPGDRPVVVADIQP